MPIYEFRCENGHTFEVIQNMSDDPVTACEQCGAPVERVFHPVAVHFKGSGFYSTDYAGKAKKDEASADGDKAKSGDSKSEEAKGKADSKSDSNSGSKGDSKAGGETGAKKAKAGSGD